MHTTAEVAWTAGIFEAEGSCRPSLHDRSGIGAIVTHKDRRLLERLRVSVLSLESAELCLAP